MEGKKKLLLASQETNQFSSKFDETIVLHQPTKSDTAPGWVIQESSISMNGYTLTEIRAICYRKQPENSEHKSEARSKTTQDPAEYFAVLGHISISTSIQNTEFPPSTSWIVKGKDVEWGGSQGSKTLSLKISWKLKDGWSSRFPRYNIYVEKLIKQAVRPQGRKLETRALAPPNARNGKTEVSGEYLGESQVEAFYVSDFIIPSAISSLKYIIQPCDSGGASQVLDDAPFFQFNVEGQ